MPGLLRAFAALLVAGILVGAPATAQSGENWAPQSFTLSNGMRAVVLPDHRAPVVTHMIWYRVGSADEAPGKSGLAHFLEHLMFKATNNLAPSPPHGNNNKSLLAAVLWFIHAVVVSDNMATMPSTSLS